MNFIRRHSALISGERVIVAVSGGPDSVTLLVILSRLLPRLGIHLTAAHFDHMLRGSREAQGDLELVAGVSETLGVGLVTGRADVRAEARRERRSLEDAARRLRYAFLAEQSPLVDASCVVTGHTMDDQAETVLLHLIRGSGLDGLVGMRPRSAWPFGPGPEVARPLLCLRRADTEKYCLELGVRPRHDPTNEALTATRNKIRHQILPQLRSLNPRVVESIGRLSQSLSEDSLYLNHAARQSFRESATSHKGAIRIQRSNLTSADPAISSRWVRLAAEKLDGSDAGIEAVHIDAVREIAAKGGGTVFLPNGLRAVANSRFLVVRRGEPETARPVAETSLKIPGTTRAGGWCISAQLVPPPATPPRGSRCEAYLDADKTGSNLTVRSRRPGDRLRPLGLGGDKKLQDILVDAKVPAAKRDGVPLICRPDGIIWVAGHCTDERYALAIESRRALHLTAVLGDR
jgi:tRNA(Ile)-lysidine synthase